MPHSVSCFLHRSLPGAPKHLHLLPFLIPWSVECTWASTWIGLWLCPAFMSLKTKQSAGETLSTSDCWASVMVLHPVHTHWAGLGGGYPSALRTCVGAPECWQESSRNTEESSPLLATHPSTQGQTYPYCLLLTYELKVITLSPKIPASESHSEDFINDIRVL